MRRLGSRHTVGTWVSCGIGPTTSGANGSHAQSVDGGSSGQNYIAHVTVGLAKVDDLTGIEAETFEPLAFAPAGISVYQLGNNGTAAEHLKNWAA